jgi:hypothetical protein
VLVEDVYIALSILLILEGVLPFLAPQLLRAGLLRILLFSDGELRVIGSACVSVGLFILYSVR